MHKFPSIEQFRNVIRNVTAKARWVGRDENGDPVFDRNVALPTLTFEGTVKLHGTNAGIVFDIDSREITYQSRERVLSLTQDNAGFMLYMSSIQNTIYQIFDDIWVPTGTKKIALYGEWCGQGIQKGVAISELPKMFVIFGIKAISEDGEGEWLDLSSYDLNDISFPDQRIYSIFDFPNYEIKIDFEKPEVAQNEMIKITEAVEAECPVGKAFGVSGIGEGVVWKCSTPGWTSSDFMFKVKGEKHSVSKVNTLAAVDVEKIANQRAFIESVVTEARLEQGVDNLVREQLLPLEMTSMGAFIRWVYNDVVKEEMDTIVANQYDPKKLGGPIADVARKWFVNRLNTNVEMV